MLSSEIDHGKYAVNRRHRLLQVAVDARETLDGIREVDGVGQERNERARRNLAVDHLVAAEPDDERDGNRREKLDRRCEHTRLLNIFSSPLQNCA